MSERIFIFILFLSSFSFFSGAQSLHLSEGGISHWEGGFNAGLNNDGYEFCFRGIYFPVQYVGIKVGLGFAGELEEVADWGEDQWETGHYYAVRFKFTPAVVLRSPCIFDWKSQNARFYLFAEPGFVLSPGARGSRHARCACFDLKTGINLQIDALIFSIGYGISDFSLYSGEPINHNGLPDKTDYTTHTVFIGASYKF